MYTVDNILKRRALRRDPKVMAMITSHPPPRMSSVASGKTPDGRFMPVSHHTARLPHSQVLHAIRCFWSVLDFAKDQDNRVHKENFVSQLMKLQKVAAPRRPAPPVRRIPNDLS